MFRVQPLAAIGADPVTEICFAVVADVDLKGVPEAVFVPNLFAGCTYRQQAAEVLDPCQRFLEFADQPVALVFGKLSFTDVANDQARSRLAFRIFEDNRRHLNWEEASIATSRIELAVGSSRLLPLGQYSG